MQVNRDQAIKRKPRRRNGKATIANMLVLCAMAGGTQAIAPASAAAMTNEELAQICAGVFDRIGDFTVCINDTDLGSGGSGGGSYGGDGSYGGGAGYAPPPTQKPETIVVTAAKPDLHKCGVFDFEAVRLVECPRKPGNQGIKAESGGSGRAKFEPTGAGSRRPGGRRPGPLTKCVLARASLREAEVARRYLDELKAHLGPDGMLDGEPEFRSVFLARAKEWIRNWFSVETWDRAFDGTSPTDKGVDLVKHVYLIKRLEKAWDLTEEEAKEDLKAPFCGKALEGRDAVSRR
jgi:hypothetical protein